LKLLAIQEPSTTHLADVIHDDRELDRRVEVDHDSFTLDRERFLGSDMRARKRRKQDRGRKGERP